ncbi:MAG: thiamine phosphate synthase [Planctomycetota bacterium]|nr:thiamine phosphate synthase [Planctomycetota bacterium]
MSLKPGQNRLPSGLWAIASHFESEQQVADFVISASLASCWTWRRPQFSGELQHRALKKMVANKTTFCHGLSDWATAVGAAGVICGAQSLAPQVLRSLDNDLLIGASVHSMSEAESLSNDVDFFVFGPIYDTPSKRDFLSPRGLTQLSELQILQKPIVAIGGVQHPDQVRACYEHGAHAVAVLRAAHDPELMAELCAVAPS